MFGLKIFVRVQLFGRASRAPVQLLPPWCPLLTQYTASLDRNAQLSQLDLVRIMICRYLWKSSFDGVAHFLAKLALNKSLIF